MKSAIALLSIVILLSCNGQKDKITPESIGNSQMALSKKANSPAFNKSFSQVLNAYFELKSNFNAEKDSGIAQSSRLLMKAADSLKLNELSADSNLILTARTYSEGISAELIGLLGEKDILAKRKSFQMVSDQFYDLIRTVQYDQITLYHAYCGNAFDDQGAYWICKPEDLKNPYLPNVATPCCEIKDTIKVAQLQ
jgi:Cu(I)/Ag(I) efflux system membrane fusion protein